MKKRIKEHDGCDGCRYFYKTEKQLPCKNCNANYLQPNGYADLWEEEPKESLSEETNQIRPNHYKNCSIECIDAMILAFGTDLIAEWCIVTAFKYIWRYKDKGGLIDLNKAIYYIDKAEELNWDFGRINSYRDLVIRLKEEYNGKEI